MLPNKKLRIYKKKKKFNQDHAKDNISNLLKNLSVMHETYLLQGGLLAYSLFRNKRFILDEIVY